MGVFEFDVFLSHSSRDTADVRILAEKLRASGLRVWFDEWNTRPGEDIYGAIQRGLESSRALILCLSPAALGPGWVTLEHYTLSFRDPDSRDRRFIPLLLTDCEVPDTMRGYACIDWRDRSSEAFARLLAACRTTSDSGMLLSSIPARTISLGYDGRIWSVALSVDGHRALCGAFDNTVRLWDLEAGRCLLTLKGHTAAALSVALSDDGRRALSGSEDYAVRFWDLETGGCLLTLEGHTASVVSVALSADGRRALSGSLDNTVRLWDLERGHCLSTLKGYTAGVLSVALSTDGRRALSGASDSMARLWDLDKGRCLSTLEGHTGSVWSVALSTDGRRALSGASDNTLRLWDLEKGRRLSTLEGHIAGVSSVALSTDGRYAVSGSEDKTVCLWDLEEGRRLSSLEGHTARVLSVALSTDGCRILSASEDNTIRLWPFPTPSPASKEARPLPQADTARYTNAKIVLAGDSGVGKTGLMYRLTRDCFKDSISTDGVWATQFVLPTESHEAGVEHEMWLWDFAGQADYRLIHQLFMDETSLAVFVFNPQSENPFEGLGSWDCDLYRVASRPFRKLLVAARIDRGGLMVSRELIERFRRERGFAEYIETSALTGSGCDELRRAIQRNIPWDEIPYTVSPRIFKSLKNEIIKLKKDGIVLLRMGELKQRLGMRLAADNFTLEQLRAVVGLLAGSGVVWQLEFGDFVLLQPERINSYAAAVVRSVRAHTEEIGCIAEEDVLAGKLDYQDMKRLPHNEEEIVLRAMHQTFVDHGLCLRESTDRGTFLIFPSYFKRECPELGDHPAVLVTYRFTGALDEIYATLVVRLHHTAAFYRDQLWRFAADFRTTAGRRLGLKMIKQPEGAAELAVYFEPDIPDETKAIFMRYVHEHLLAKTLDVLRLRHYVCPRCGSPVKDREAAWERLRQGMKDILCVRCEARIPLLDVIESSLASNEFHRRVQEMREQACTRIDEESTELVVEAHVMSVVSEAGQILRRTSETNRGIDGEIEFKDYRGDAAGRRLYLQLRSGDYYGRARRQDGAEVFTIREARWAKHWRQCVCPVMLVIRMSDGAIRWMDVSEYLKRESRGGKKEVEQIVFEGEPLTALNLLKLREKLVGPPPIP